MHVQPPHITQSDCLKGQCHEIFCFWFFHESASVGKIAAGINDCTGINDSGGKFSISFARVVDSDGKFATGISPRIFEIIRNGPNGINQRLGGK